MNGVMQLSSFVQHCQWTNYSHVQLMTIKNSTAENLIFSHPLEWINQIVIRDQLNR